MGNWTIMGTAEEREAFWRSHHEAWRSELGVPVEDFVDAGDGVAVMALICSRAQPVSCRAVMQV